MLAMESPFQITFPNQHTAFAIRVQQVTELPTALGTLGLSSPRPTLVVIGGAGGMREHDLARLRPLFARVFAPIIQELNGFIVDGGTYSGVMRLMGDAHAQTSATFSLIGVAAEQTVVLPGHVATRKDAASLDHHHTHFVLTPGSNWGDESPWLSHVASILTGASPSVTVLINGGEITWDDVANSIKANRPVITIAGTGRMADEFAHAAHGKTHDKRAIELVSSGLISAVELKDDLSSVADKIRQMLTPQ